MTEKFVLDAEIGKQISKAAEDFMKNVLAAYDKMLEAEIEANVIVLNGNKFSFLKKPGFAPTLFGMKVEYENLPESWDFYLQYRAKSKTNADRIRSMTDEELAKFLDEAEPDCYMRYEDEEGYSTCKSRNCEECWLIWLKQEETDGT